MFVVDRFGPVVRIRMAPTLLGRPLEWVNCFWVAGTLIDTGCRKTVPDLLRALEQEGLKVNQVIHTHTDEDHIGADSEIHRRLWATPQAHPLGVAAMAHPERLPLYRQFFWGAVGPCVAADLGDVVAAGPYRFTVIPTPGHAPDHVAFWEEREGWLFTGDLMLSPRLQRVRAPEDPLAILESLRRLAALPVKRIFCCHAKWVPESAEPLRKKIDYWERLRKEGAVLRTRGLPLRTVTRRLLGRPGLIEWVSGGEFSRIHLMRGLLREV